MITNETATIDALKTLAEAYPPVPVRLWRAAGGGARADGCWDCVLRRASWLPEYSEFTVLIQGLRGEFSTYLALPPGRPWTITPICPLPGCGAEVDAFGCTGHHIEGVDGDHGR